ncbi:MAG: ABC transporter substrate-binding protein [Oscillospiraceae bacterium]
MNKIIQRVFTTVLAVAMLTGCNQGEKVKPNSETISSSEVSQVSQSSTAEKKEQHYPVTITNYNYAGEEVTTVYEKAPEKVLAIYQGSIETMIALGLEDKVVAAYGLDNEVKEIWKDGLSKMHYDESVFAPDKETVTAMQPDMIFSWGSIFSDKKFGDVSNWESKGTHCYMNTNTRPGGHTRTIANECTDLLNIGKIFNVEDKAQELVDQMQNKIAEALKATEGKEPQSVAVVELMKDTISNYSTKSLAGDIVTQLGGKLSMPETNKISKEDLIAVNPNAIFVVYMSRDTDIEATGKEKVAKITEDPAYASLDAVKNGRIYPILLGDLYASTVRTIDGINTISNGLYPESNK